MSSDEEIDEVAHLSFSTIIRRELLRSDEGDSTNIATGDFRNARPVAIGFSWKVREKLE